MVDRLTEELRELNGRNLIMYAFQRISIREITSGYEVVGGTYHTHLGEEEFIFRFAWNN